MSGVRIPRLLLLCGVLVGFAIFILAFTLDDPDPSRRDEAEHEQSRTASHPLSGEAPPRGFLARTTLDTEEDDALPAGRTGRGLLEVVVEHANGRPAFAVGVSVQLRGEIPLVGETARDGRVRFADVPGGKVVVWNDRTTASTTAHVIAGRRTEVRVTVSGRTVTGVVRDGLGVGIADASIVFDGLYQWLESTVVAHTATDGRFAIHSTPADGSIWAFAPGFAPSRVVPLRHIEGRIQLVLRNRGTEVQGRVVGPRSVPVTGAVVGIGRPEIRIRTDDRGRFRVRGLALGNTPVWVRARGHAEWRSEVAVSESMEELFIRLRPGAVCRGVVRDSSGEPAAGARVIAQQPGVREVSTTVTTSNGSFELSGLPEGELEFVVEGAARGRVVRVLTSRIGESLVWNPTLPVVRMLSGRVVSTDGSAVAGVHVRVASEVTSSPFGARGKTDADGRFVFEGVSTDRLTIIIEHAPLGIPMLVERGVRPGGLGIRLRVDRARLPSAFVRAEIRDPDGKRLSPDLLKSAQYFLLGPEVAGHLPRRLEDDGTLNCGPLPPATVEIAVAVPGFARYCSGPRRLQVGESLDLGALRLRRK